MDYTISDQDFNLFAKLVYNKTGIDLSQGNKKQLLQSRVNKVLRTRGIGSYKEYYEIVKNDSSGSELEDFINLISTNVTHFFREEKHFEFLREHWFPSFDFKRTNCVRIWCSASSTGEEPYSISITMKELLGDKFPYDIYASDIDTKVLQAASKGIYKFSSVEKMDKPLLKKYFQQGKGSAEGYVKAKENIRKHINYHRVNLIEPFNMPHKFDIIFCRNVMIYFDNPTKSNIVHKFFNLMNPESYLLIGHSESLNGFKHPFKYVQPATYMREK
jgi:chemotaxis protein methyltransferase CheR